MQTNLFSDYTPVKYQTVIKLLIKALHKNYLDVPDHDWSNEHLYINALKDIGVMVTASDVPVCESNNLEELTVWISIFANSYPCDEHREAEIVSLNNHTDSIFTNCTTEQYQAVICRLVASLYNIATGQFMKYNNLDTYEKVVNMLVYA